MSEGNNTSESDDIEKKQLAGLLRVEPHDWSIIPHVLSQITLIEWRTAQAGKFSFKKSAIDSNLTIESTLLELLNKMSDQSNNLCFLAIANSDHTQISATISLRDLLKFMVSNYNGDLTTFRMHDVASFAKQTLVRANEHDSLLHALRIMADSRISVLPIERKIED